MDDRIAAEILLRFYEDLALRGQAEPLPDLSGAMGWHPLHERLSNRKDTLDEALTDLGISPHPRVVLALEGETEAYHAPLVWRTLGYSSAPELIRVLKLGSVGQNLQKVAALNVAPLIGKQVPASGSTVWTVIRPSAYLLMAVDPDKPFNGRPRPIRAEQELHATLEAPSTNGAAVMCRSSRSSRSNRGIGSLSRYGKRRDPGFG